MRSQTLPHATMATILFMIFLITFPIKSLHLLPFILISKHFTFTIFIFFLCFRLMASFFFFWFFSHFFQSTFRIFLSSLRFNTCLVINIFIYSLLLFSLLFLFIFIFIFYYFIINFFIVFIFIFFYLLFLLFF